jgi:Holliday junction resolvase RusA-like endonuclease
MIYAEWSGKAWGSNRRLEKGKYGNIHVNSEYHRFQNGLTWMLIAYNTGKKPLTGDVRVHLDFTIAINRDIDSLIKPVLDCLQKAQILKNDSQITRLFVSKKAKKRREEDRIRIVVQETNH